MKKLFAKSLLIAALLVFFVAVPSHAWLIVTDVGASNELIDNSTDGFIDFQGMGGADNTDVRLDLDGTHPIFSSATDSTIEIAGTAILNTVTIATTLTVNEDFVIALNAADEEITINQTSAAGTEDVGLIKINDDRTGATATEQSEATIWIDAEGVFAIAAIDGAIAAEGGFFPATSDGADIGSTSLEFADLFLADASIIKFGADQDVTLTHVADTGLLLNTTMQLQFGDNSTYIYQSANGVLSAVSDNIFDITSVTFNTGVDAAAYLSIVTTNAGETTISQTSDGTDQIAIGDNTDLVTIEAGNWDVDSSGNITTAGDIGSTSVEIDDIFMSDGAILNMGADQDVVITHVADAGVTMRVTADAGFIIVLQSSDTTITDGSELGRINFQAPLESSGTDAILFGAAIYAEADIEFAIDANATDIVFETAITDTAAEVARLRSTGDFALTTGAFIGVRKITSTGSGRTLTADELKGGIVLVTAAVEVSLPDVCDSATGYYVTIVQADASEKIEIGVIDTADDMFLDGISLGANQEIDSAAAAKEDDYITLYCREANEWHQTDKVGTWVDGGGAD